MVLCLLRSGGKVFVAVCGTGVVRYLSGGGYRSVSVLIRECRPTITDNRKADRTTD